MSISFYVPNLKICMNYAHCKTVPYRNYEKNKGKKPNFFGGKRRGGEEGEVRTGGEEGGGE